MFYVMIVTALCYLLWPINFDTEEDDDEIRGYYLPEYQCDEIGDITISGVPLIISLTVDKYSNVTIHEN